MRRLGAARRFGALIGADTLPVRKPDPAPYRAAVTGAGGEISRSFWWATRRPTVTPPAAGVPSVLVTFGPEGRAVADLAPEGLLHHYDMLPDEVARLIGRPG